MDFADNMKQQWVEKSIRDLTKNHVRQFLQKLSF